MDTCVLRRHCVVRGILRSYGYFFRPIEMDMDSPSWIFDGAGRTSRRIRILDVGGISDTNWSSAVVDLRTDRHPTKEKRRTIQSLVASPLLNAVSNPSAQAHHSRTQAMDGEFVAHCGHRGPAMVGADGGVHGGASGQGPD